MPDKRYDRRRTSSDQEWLDGREGGQGEGSESVIGDLNFQDAAARAAARSPASFRALAPKILDQTIFVDRPFTVGTTSILLSPSKPYRSYLLIQNSSGGIMYFSFDKAATTTKSIKITAGGFYEAYFRVPTNQIHIIGAAANLNGVILEGYTSQSTLREQ